MGNQLTGDWDAEAVKPFKEVREARQAQVQTRLDDISGAVTDFDNWEKDLTTEQKNRKIINGLMEVKLGRLPESPVEYEQARAKFANLYFEGKGGDSDEALMAQITAESVKRKANVDLHDSLQKTALIGALGGASYGEWAEKNTSPDMSMARRDSLLHAYNEYQREATEQFGDPLRFAKKAFGKLVTEDAGDALDYIEGIADKLDTEDHETFLGLLREVVLENPHEKVDELLAEMDINIGIVRDAMGIVGRSAHNVGKSIEMVGDLASDTGDVFEEGVAGTATPRTRGELIRPTSNQIEYSIMPESFKADKERARAVKNRNALVSDARRIFREDYDPIQLNTSSNLGRAIEEGIYALPSTVATIAAVAVPYVGLPVVGATMFGSSRTKFRQRMIANGVDRERAQHMADKLGLIAAAPMLALERMQALSFVGEVPMMGKLMTAVGNRINNKMGRFVGRFAVANIGETNIEMGQELVEEVVQMMGASFSEFVPDVEWYNGKDGVFDGYAYKYISTMVAVAPAGGIAALGGISADGRAKAFKALPRNVRSMHGVSDAHNDRIDEAETMQEVLDSTSIGMAEADPNSDTAKDAVEDFMMEQELEKTSLSNLKRSGYFPIIRADKSKDGVVEVVHPETGEVIDRIDNNPQAVAESTIAYMELQDQATTEQIDELALMVEAAQLDVKEAQGKDQVVELELGTNMDVQGFLENFPEFKDRVINQVNRLEQLTDIERVNGGDGGMSRAVYGQNFVEHNGEQIKTSNRLWAGTSAMTLVHERGHDAFKRALKSGAMTLEKAFDFFTELDSALVGKTDKNGNQLRFMPEGTTAKDYTKIDEAVAEFMEVMLLQSRKGKKTAMRDVVGRQMSAMVKARRANAGSFKGFLEAMKDFFGKVLARDVILKKGIREGVVDKGRMDEFHNALLGNTDAESFKQEVDQELGDPSLSIGESQDATYMQAVESGDMGKAQAMVDARAKGAGYDVRTKHATGETFEAFKRDKIPAVDPDTNIRGFHVSNEADAFSSYSSQSSENKVLDLFVKTGREVSRREGQRMVAEGDSVDGFPKGFDTVVFTRGAGTPTAEQLEAYEKGEKVFQPNDPSGHYFQKNQDDLGADYFNADGDVITGYSDLSDGFSMFSEEHLVIRNPNQIKSADPVTYDSDGNVIPLSQRFDEGRDEISLSVGEVPAEIADSKSPIVEQIYLKETAKFKEGVASGRIKTEADIRDFIGKHMVMHQPDTAMAGEVKVDGESFVKGKGGVYYPVLFSDEGYFWASTAAKAEEMAGALNEISERNGGSIYMALTSADVDKLFSSTTMSVGTMNFFKQLTKNPRKYGITENQLNKMLIKASKAQVVKKTLIKDKDKKPILNKKGEKTYNVKTQEFGYKLPKGTNLEQTMTELEGWLQPFSSDKTTGSSFDVRKAFVFDLMRHVSLHLKERPTKAKAVAELLTHDSNEFAKSKVMKGQLSPAAFAQGLGDMLSEPLTKTFQQFDSNKRTGYIYAVIEIEGKVKAVDTDGHESYPKAIVSAEGKLPTVHVMKDGYHWTDVVQEKDSGARVERKTGAMNKVYPTGGFSAYKTRPIQFGEVQDGAEGVELSFSIGDAQMNETLISNARMRVRDPEGVATVMESIMERVENLKREVPKIIQAFGKEVTMQPIVDKVLLGDLRRQAREMRQEKIEDAENAIYEQYGDVLSNEDLVSLKSQPITELVMAEGGMESLTAAKRRRGDAELKAGEFESIAGLPPMYYGGTQTPDQMAQQLYAQGLIKDADVETMMDAIDKEIYSVSSRKAELKKARKAMNKAKKDATKETTEWLDERIAEQERDYNPMVRARRALVKLSAIRRSLPLELRGMIEGDAKLLSMGDEARLKYLEQAIERVDVAVTRHVTKELRSAIKDTFKRIRVKEKRGKLSPETQAEMEIIEAMTKMTAKEVKDKLSELYEVIDADPMGGSNAVHEQIAMLHGYGNISEMKARDLSDLLKTLVSIEKRGRTIRAIKAEARKRGDEASRTMAIDVVSGGKGKMTDEQSAIEAQKLREKKRSVLKGAVTTDGKFHGMNLSFEGLLNMLSRKDVKSGSFKSALNNKFARMAHKATRMEDDANRSFQNQYTQFMRGVFDMKGVKLSSHISKVMMDASDTGVNRIIMKDGKPVREERLIKSQSQAIALVMMFRQGGIRESMIKEGYSKAAMSKLEKDFLTKESKQIMEWMALEYEANYERVNAVYKEQYGFNLPKIEFYAPVRRIVDKDHGGDGTLPLGGDQMGFGSTPAFLSNRETNMRKIDPTASAMDIFMSHMLQSNHYVAWAEPIRQMRSTFNNADVRQTVKDYSSNEVLGLIDERIQWMADGGNREAKRIKFLDNMRLHHTFGSLAYDLGITIKQLTSLPAYAFDMGLPAWIKYQTKFFEHPIKHAKEMIKTDYVQTRFKNGYTRDVAEGLRLEGGNTLEAYILKGFQTGMMFGKVGDIVPVIAGGWAAKQHAYDKARADGLDKKQAEAESIIAFEMATDRSQQAVNQKDLSSFSGGGSIAKLFTMYKTSPRQYYANSYETLRDAFAGRKGAKKEALNKLVIAHVILPNLFQFVSDAWRMIGDEDKELEGSDYLRAMLLGPLNGLFIAGEALSPLAAIATGSKRYDTRLPIYGSITAVSRAIEGYSRGDFWSATHDLAMHTGKASPFRLTNALTYYSIISKQAKLLGRFTD